jgi:hypothetical protein
VALTFLLAVEPFGGHFRVFDVVLREVTVEYACFDLTESAADDSSSTASDDSSAGWSSDDSDDD